MAVINSGPSRVERMVKLGVPCAGGAPDGDPAPESDPKTVPEGDPKPTTEGDPKPSPEGDPVPAPAPAPVSVPKGTRLVLGDGSETVPLSDAQMRHYAQQGVEAAMRDAAANAEPEPEPEPEPKADPNEDPMDKKLRLLEARQVKSDRDLEVLRASQVDDKRTREVKETADRNRKTVAALLDKHAEWADEDTRKAIKGYARELLDEAHERGEKPEDGQVIATSAKFFAEKTVAVAKAREEDKQHTRETAAEAGGGIAALFGGSRTPAAPKTREERRAIAAKMDDGTADQEAVALLREYAAAAAG